MQGQAHDSYGQKFLHEDFIKPACDVLICSCFNSADLADLADIPPMQLYEFTCYS